MADNITLRVLTEKSIIDFGKYSGMTVKSIMATSNTYIVWVYYHASMISFCDEILKKYNIIPIPKPGTSPRTFALWQKQRSQEYTEEQKEHHRFKRYHAKRRQARRRIATAIRENSVSKGAMQSANQGRGDGIQRRNYKENI